MPRRHLFSAPVSVVLAVAAAVEGAAAPCCATASGTITAHGASFGRYQGRSPCRRAGPATRADWLVDPASFVVELREPTESLLVRVTPQFADWARISATAGGFTWDCGALGRGWGLRVLPDASSDWNELLTASRLDSLATSSAAAGAVALVFLSFALAEPLVTADTGSAVLGQARVTFGQLALRGPPVSIAVYWVEDSWAVNGRIGTASDYTFEISMNRTGKIRSVSLEPRPRE